MKSLLAQLTALLAAFLASVAWAEGMPGSAIETVRHAPGEAQPAPNWRGAFEPGQFVGPDGVVIRYQLLRPPPGNAPHPLVVVLHGSGEMGSDNEAQMGAFASSWAAPEIVRQFPAYVVAPQFPVRTVEYHDAADGAQASHDGAGMPALLGLIGKLAGELPVDPERIYVAGFSMGGSTALRLAADQGELIAAAVAFSPIPPDRDRPPGAPVLIVHGNADTVTPIDASLSWAQRHGLRMIRYEGLGHEVPADLLPAADWRAWLFSKKKAAKSGDLPPEVDPVSEETEAGEN